MQLNLLKKKTVFSTLNDLNRIFQFRQWHWDDAGKEAMFILQNNLVFPVSYHFIGDKAVNFIIYEYILKLYEFI